MTVLDAVRASGIAGVPFVHENESKIGIKQSVLATRISLLFWCESPFSMLRHFIYKNTVFETFQWMLLSQAWFKSMGVMQFSMLSNCYPLNKNLWGRQVMVMYEIELTLSVVPSDFCTGKQDLCLESNRCGNICVWKVIIILKIQGTSHSMGCSRKRCLLDVGDKNLMLGYLWEYVWWCT